MPRRLRQAISTVVGRVRGAIERRRARRARAREERAHRRAVTEDGGSSRSRRRSRSRSRRRSRSRSRSVSRFRPKSPLPVTIRTFPACNCGETSRAHPCGGIVCNVILNLDKDGRLREVVVQRPKGSKGKEPVTVTEATAEIATESSSGSSSQSQPDYEPSILEEVEEGKQIPDPEEPETSSEVTSVSTTSENAQPVMPKMPPSVSEDDALSDEDVKNLLEQGTFSESSVPELEEEKDEVIVTSEKNLDAMTDGSLSVDEEALLKSEGFEEVAQLLGSVKDIQIEDPDN